jgi:hypothetical protein
MNRPILAAALLLAACGQQPQAAPAAEPANGAASDSATGGSGPQEPAPAAPAAAPAPAPDRRTAGSGSIGPLRFRYDPAKLVALDAPVSVPPDWTQQVPGIKLVAADRAALIGRAECLYGQSGEASRCNATQEAGLAFAIVAEPFAGLSAKLSPELRRGISLAGRDGVSWQIGAEGEGAEHILLAAGNRTLLIVRHYRESGNADEAAVREVLANLKIDG